MSRWYEIPKIKDSDVWKYLHAKAEGKKNLMENETTITIDYYHNWITYGWFGMEKNTIPMEVNWCFCKDYKIWDSYGYFSEDYKYYYYQANVCYNDILVRFPTYLLFKNIILDNVNFAQKYINDEVIAGCLHFMYNEMIKHNFKGKSKIRKSDFLGYGVRSKKEKILNAMTIYLNFKAQNYGK